VEDAVKAFTGRNRRRPGAQGEEGKKEVGTIQIRSGTTFLEQLVWGEREVELVKGLVKERSLTRGDICALLQIPL